MKTYRIQFRYWVPGYDEFDYDETTIEANSEDEAVRIFNTFYNYVTNFKVELIDGTKS